MFTWVGLAMCALSPRGEVPVTYWDTMPRKAIIAGGRS